jgi:hypothetical protein
MAAVAIAAAIAIAACDTSKSSSSGSPGSGSQVTYAQAQRAAVAFARCIRSHGVPNFPDPASPRGLKDLVGSSLAQSPAFRSAAMTCRHLLPGGGGSPRPGPASSRAQITALLAFAGCLRRHGFPSFPDPTPTGQLTHEMLANAGIDVHEPAVLQAADACVSVTHGVLTKARVARFAAGR